MSTTIDSRVVEMRFDNRQFESNVSTTMSTLDKLKQRLNLTGASKGLENVNAAAKGVNLSGLANAVETVHAKFSALQVMGVTALANITNSAVNTGKQLVKSLSVDQITAGWSKYDQKTASVQSIINATGKSIDEVNTYLNKLMWFSDETSYGFTDMTQALGQLTSAGGDIDKLIPMITGIANATAYAGKGTAEFSRSIYNLNQSYSAGNLQYMDWKSLELAGIASKELKQTFIDTGIALGKIKEGEVTIANFGQTLQKRWADTSVMEAAFGKFGEMTEKAYEMVQAGDVDTASEAYAKLSEEYNTVSMTAAKAAQEAKTFGEALDATKDAVSSGWMKTFEIIFGNYEEAKVLWTDVANTLWDVFASGSEARNEMLGDAMMSNWDKMIVKITEAGVKTTDFDERLRATAESHGIDVSKMIKDHGSLENAFKSGAISSDILNEAISGLERSIIDLSSVERKLSIGKTGEDVEKVQKALTKLGYAIDDREVEGKFSWYTAKAVQEFQKAQGLKVTGIVDNETLRAMEAASGSAEGLSENVGDLVSNIDKLGGRELLIEALWNAFDGIQSVVTPVKEALSDIFPPITADHIYQFSERLKTFTEGLILSSETAEKIKRIFKGVFSVFDIGKKILGNVATAFLDLAGSSGVSTLATFLLDTAASIGDFLTALNESFDGGGLSGMLSTAVSGISNFLGVATGKIESFGDILGTVGKFIVKVASNIWGGLKEVFGWISDTFSTGDILAGLAGGGIFVAAKKFTGLIEYIKEGISGLFGKGEDGESGGLKEKFTELLDGVGETLQSFTSSVKVGSFVAIAAAIAILASAFGKISELDAEDIAQSLVTMGVSLAFMMRALNSMPKSTKLTSGLTKFSENTSLVKSGVALILLAKAIDILAEAMLKLSDLSWEEIGKGLVGVGGGIAAICGGLKLLNGTKISIGTSIAMLALAEACKILGDAMTKFVGFSWDEIARGLAGMGGALGELVLALTILSKAGGFGSLLGSLGILITVQSLGEMAEGLKSFAAMSWDEIGRGLAAMGGALVEVAGITGVLGKLAGISSIFASGAIFITVQSLADLFNAFKDFGSMSWEEIGKGLIGMGGALAEVAAITGALGMLAGFSGILGGGAIWLTVQSLNDLAIAFQSFGSMSWGEIGRGLVAMGGALIEVGAVAGALGMLAGFSGILGGAAIWVTVQSLSDLATAFQSFAAMTWDEIGRGLVAMGGALAEVAGITGALGALAGLPALLGGGAILLAVQGLGDLADALKKFGEMSWDEIGRGLAGMGAALGEVALGGLLSSLSGLGAAAISEMAAPLGVLAESVQKWSGVTVPDGLGTQLSDLALGVMEFTFGGLGASAIAEVAGPLGVMADSISKWSGVTVPDTLGDNLIALAAGVKEFTWGGLGAGALAEAAPGVGAMADSVAKWSSIAVPESLGSTLSSLGTAVGAFTFGGNGAGNLAEAAPGVASMADSVAKWSGVAVPEGLGTSLSELATGVKAFTFGGFGAGSIAEAAPGIGTLADSIVKWANVTIPEGLVDNLDTLAEGVKKFTFGGSGAESIAACASGLGVMADSVKKWTGLVVPENLGTNMSSLATGVKEFAWSGGSADNLSVAATGLDAMADAAAKWVKLTVPENFGDTLNNLSTAVTDIAGIGDLSSINTSISELATNLTELAGVAYQTVADGLSSLATSITDLSKSSGSVSGLGTKIFDELVAPLKNTSVDVSTVGTNIVNSMVDGVKKQQPSFNTTINTVISEGAKAAESNGDAFKTTGETLGTKLSDGLKDKQTDVSGAGKKLSEKAVSGAREKYKDMKSGGEYVGKGFVLGIKAKENDAYWAGYDLGKAAKRGEADATDEGSPCRDLIQSGKWFGEGFVIGINSMSDAVYKAGSTMGEEGLSAISSAISKISETVNSDIDAQPVIRPVLDLSDIKTGANRIGGMFNSDPIGLMANLGEVSMMMNKRGQNGANKEVVAAITKLREDIANMPRESYNINGVTYDDGSNIKSFAQAVVHQARLERRV